VRGLAPTAWLLTALLTLLVYGVAAADTNLAVCFGADGHVALEGSAEHQQAATGSSDGFYGEGHGPCVDPVMPAREGGAIDVPAPVIAESLPVVAAPVRNAARSVSRRDTIQPHAGLGSTLLRI
jgi:hypothetical protein